MKLTIEDIEKVLRDNAITGSTITKITSDLEAIEADKKDEAAPGPKAKNKLVIFANDKDSGWVLQVKEDMDEGLIEGKLSAAAKAFNTTSRKAKKHPIKGWGDLFAALPRKFAKAEEILIKTKVLTRVITPTKNP